MAVTRTPMRQLELVTEAKVFDILEGVLSPRLEASGVLAKDGMFYVIFDNLPQSRGSIRRYPRRPRATRSSGRTRGTVPVSRTSPMTRGTAASTC